MSFQHPILLKGHTGPLSKVRFNRQGDIFFSCAKKDTKINAWFADNGERLGTYNGHQGAIWDVDSNFHSTRLLTASADRYAKLWDLQTGRLLVSIEHKSSVRCVRFAQGDKMILSVQDDNFQQQPTIFIYNLPEDEELHPDMKIDSVLQIQLNSRIAVAVWGHLNRTIIAACADGTIRIFDTMNGNEICRAGEGDQHRKHITDMQLSKDRTQIITSSADHTAKVIEDADFFFVILFVRLQTCENELMSFLDQPTCFNLGRLSGLDFEV
jgi:translation initiation factor 3 subunit I